MAKFFHLIATFNLDKVMCQMSACSMSVFELLSWNATQSGLECVIGHFWRGVLEITEYVWSLDRCRPILCRGLLCPQLINLCVCPDSVFVVTVFTHQLCHSVDVDFSLLQASTEKHGCCHQKVVGYTVSINIHRCNLTAIVGADLKAKYMRVIK